MTNTTKLKTGAFMVIGFLAAPRIIGLGILARTTGDWVFVALGIIAIIYLWVALQLMNAGWNGRGA